MKTTLLTLLVLLACSSCNGPKSIDSGDLRLEVDAQMQWLVQSKAEGVDSFVPAFAPASILTTDEAVISEYLLEKTTRIKGGYLFSGRHAENDIDVEKHQRIYADKDFPGMLLVETSYVNRGRDLTLRSLVENRLAVTADSLVWSFEPSSTSWRKDWILPVRPGFEQKNYLGMNSTDYGGGIPMVSLWRRDGGLSAGLVEPHLEMISMPVEWIEGEDHATLALRQDFDDNTVLKSGDTLAFHRSFISTHKGDFYNPLHQFSEYMQQRGGIEMPASEPEAFRPVWCAWGYERTFTIDEVLGTLPKVAEVGFEWVDVDDGFQIAEGDWEPNSRFPGGDADMRRLTDAIHAAGMKAKLWWAPLAADPGTNCLHRHPEMQLVTKEGTPEEITYWDSYYLSPVNPVTERYTLDLVDLFIDKWNFDGLKLDGQHLNLCMPDYNPHSGLAYPEQSVHEFPSIFRKIYDRTRGLKDYAVVQLCPCGCAFNFFNIPYMNQAVASDPTSSFQIRLKGKAYKAINSDLAYYADHVELSDTGLDFATQVGIGGVVGSKFTWPKNNPNVKADYRLTPEKEPVFKKWVSIYKEKMLSTGDYLNLYDIAWDLPETHVIRKDDRMYYAFYADEWNGEPITLRGLEAGRSYTVCEYAAEGATYTLDGANPVITPQFKESYLIEVF